jgi:hypothetical protein
VLPAEALLLPYLCWCVCCYCCGCCSCVSHCWGLSKGLSLLVLQVRALLLLLVALLLLMSAATLELLSC